MGVRTVDLVDPKLFRDGPPHDLLAELRAHIASRTDWATEPGRLSRA
jgi:hypothetical protein